MRKLLLVCVALIAALPASAAVRGGLVYGPVYGPAFGPWGYGYAPYFYGPYPVATAPAAGLVKLDTKAKGAEVYIDGAFAGKAGDLKSLWLRQGAYDLEIRSPGLKPFEERIYVVSGKTLHVRPELRVAPTP